MIQKYRPDYWPVYGEEEELIEPLNSDLCQHLTLKYKEFSSMNDLCCAINRKISTWKNDALHFNYFIEHARI